MKPALSFKGLIFSFLLILFTQTVGAQQAQVTVQQDEKIPELLALKKQLEKDNKLSDKFTIQLYYGEQSRARSVLRRYRGFYATWPASIEYETPNYKVWVGNFSSRLDAERALLKIKKNFDDAFVLNVKQ